MVNTFLAWMLLRAGETEVVHSSFDVLGEAPCAELSTPACYLYPWWAVRVDQEASTVPDRVNSTTHPRMLAPCTHCHLPGLLTNYPSEPEALYQQAL